ncbi:peptidyl-prolyl cis-trans isomerase CYP28, chloroplastic isoform X1 [Morus notabilis]|uniref:peptidyl-prolyl cis-trans isomerase CYP28, chloroplastic isoform X1 n=1 Tax=Morus notabilis TaxID=981085 RepID=UPI000CED3B74|nr:peptidyl-prolyl cis-trans isomerase CYP28, chloroplastic isoform X1 [Morus notabilis]
MGCPVTALPPLPPPIFSHHRRRHLHETSTTTSSRLHLTRRSLLLSTTLFLSSPPPSSASPPPPPPPSPLPSSAPDTTITERVYLDFSLCPNYFRPDRTLSDDVSSLCSDSLLLGRVVLGLYGKHVPLTVSNFKSMCTSATYKGSFVHKLFPGQFLLAGRQGDKPGEVRRPSGLARNTETVDAKAFALTHSRPGLLSLCLSENDDDDEMKLDPEYRNVEFLITTGPGPCPQLDGKNIVFGSVLEVGLDVVTSIAAIPTYRPAERIRQFNDLAKFLGDERAQNARASWNRPLKTVFISDCGEIQVAKPSLSPSLP